MSYRAVFSDIPSVHAAFNAFQRVHAPLYHYTSNNSADAIVSGEEFWLTRADGFLDESEISYGTAVVTQAMLQLNLTEELSSRISGTLLRIHHFLRSAFVLSLTLDPRNGYLATHYGSSVLCFKPSFPLLFSNCTVHHRTEHDGFKVHFTCDYFEPIEGAVIYDRDVQIEAAKKVVLAVVDVLLQSGSPVEPLHARELLITSILLCKDFKYSPENEYRFALIRKDTCRTLPMEYATERVGREVHFMRARMLHFQSDFFQSRVGYEGEV